MRGISFDSAKPPVVRALALAGVALTLAVAAVPAQASKPTSPGKSATSSGKSAEHQSGGGDTGHKVGG